ncbi:hypothetical protein BX616_001013 [Lobosporangium transversale]|uniref:Uncharacterized protein n=1 Tax=Lobosporangium transversale TaxID=64571 RepID=A0A1Y2GY34_9FUNG|nr:hypothetical protein BCR41DRAFT_392524 [Lobosporangium transversale]KAF9917430.1 hypothetical protein BX616_001013 [Lobosporangium transversale]ORZ27186.1 hypothetical protein BCR41DRAFT_392524 [Lobosporangium transversale]|eukprot:XP_021884913.1 hypothetical protein BCR41DRAFT_392524 [Lobosporangium transversale]
MHTLEITEILERVGYFIPLWGVDDDGNPVYLPYNMAPCLAVSHHFRATLLPLFWHTVDLKVMTRIHVKLMLKYIGYVRVVYNLGAQNYDLYQQAFSAWTNLIHLSNIENRSGELDADVMQIIQCNPTLKSIGLAYDLRYVKGPPQKLHQDLEASLAVGMGGMAIVDDAAVLSNLNTLECLELISSGWGDWVVDIERLSDLLRPVASTLRYLRISKPMAERDIRARALIEKSLSESEERKEREKEKEKEIDKLLFPRLEELHVPRIMPEDLQPLFSTGSCPKLHTISTAAFGEETLRFLQQLSQQQKQQEGLVHRSSTTSHNAVDKGYPQQLYKVSYKTRGFLHQVVREMVKILPHAHSLDISVNLWSIRGRIKFDPLETYTIQSLHLELHRSCEGVEFLLKELVGLRCLRLLSLEISQLYLFDPSTLLNPEDWTYPGDLTSLSFNGTHIRYNTTPYNASQWKTKKDSEVLAKKLYYGWKVQGPLLRQSLNFLEPLFKLANNHKFKNLKTLVFNGNVYRKILEN